MGKSVLVVDDSAMIRMQVKRALLGAGFEVCEAIDGQDAWDKLGRQFALMVCDVNMPRMSGIELLQRMREEGKLDELPVLMLTTEAQPDLIRMARGLGAKGWLVKPFRADMLVATVSKMVGAGVP